MSACSGVGTTMAALEALLEKLAVPDDAQRRAAEQVLTEQRERDPAGVRRPRAV